MIIIFFILLPFPSHIDFMSWLDSCRTHFEQESSNGETVSLLQFNDHCRQLPPIFCLLHTAATNLGREGLRHIRAASQGFSRNCGNQFVIDTCVCSVSICGQGQRWLTVAPSLSLPSSHKGRKKLEEKGRFQWVQQLHS